MPLQLRDPMFHLCEMKPIQATVQTKRVSDRKALNSHTNCVP